MGVGNRFKKQGMPEPLDESKVTRKRKDYVPEPAKANKKRRTSQELPARPVQKKVKETNGRDHAKKSEKNAVVCANISQKLPSVLCS